MSPSRDYTRIEHALGFIERERARQPGLSEIAREVGLSEHHFHRLFVRWAGVTPKQFLSYLTKEHARSLLEEGRSVLDAALDSGLSGPSRLHDLVVESEGVTPGELKSGGLGVELRYGVHPSPFGPCFLATSPRGVVALSFVRDVEPESAIVEWLRGRWPEARLIKDPESTRAQVAAAFSPGPGEGLRLFVRGSKFQVRVWRALLEVPEGRLVTYGDLARSLQQPGATRAVGTAVGQNPISFLIPCHRVIRSIGTLGQYRWGPLRKAALVGFEQAQKQRFRAG